MIKIVCDKCGKELYMKTPDLRGRSKIGFEEFNLCRDCVLEVKRFINQGKLDRNDEEYIREDARRTLDKSLRQVYGHLIEDDSQTEREVE